MKITNTRLFVQALNKKVEIFWRVKDPDKSRYPWTPFVLDEHYLNFDSATFEYYCDCPIAMWTDFVQERYVKLMAAKDFAEVIQESQDCDLLGDYWHYSGFIRGKYHVRMDYGQKWIGIWEVEDEV